jgi:DNA-binding MarR family transcriptional regulator
MSRPDPSVGRCLDFDTYVPGLITWLANKLSSGASRTYRERYGLGIIDWRVLASVAAEDGCTATRICQVVGLDKAAVSRSFSLLCARGLVTLGEGPLRAKPARLTAAGREVHDGLLDLALARQQRLLHGMSPAETVELTRLLHKLLAGVPHANADVDVST